MIRDLLTDNPGARTGLAAMMEPVGVSRMTQSLM